MFLSSVIGTEEAQRRWTVNWEAVFEGGSSGADVWHIKNHTRKKKNKNKKKNAFCSHFVWVSVWGNEFTALQMAYMSFICCSFPAPP